MSFISNSSNVSTSSTLRRNLIASVRKRDQLPADYQFAVETILNNPAALMAWDDAPENTEMDWEQRLSAESLADDVIVDVEDPSKSAMESTPFKLAGLNIKAETEELIHKVAWNPRTEFAIGFGSKEPRAHAVEGIYCVLFIFLS